VRAKWRFPEQLIIFLEQPYFFKRRRIGTVMPVAAAD
jgi:hypothetical protein